MTAEPLKCLQFSNLHCNKVIISVCDTFYLINCEMAIRTPCGQQDEIMITTNAEKMRQFSDNSRNRKLTDCNLDKRPFVSVINLITKNYTYTLHIN